MLINKLVYLGLSILDLNETIRYQFWYDYVKAKYDKKTKLCFMDKNVIRKDSAEDIGEKCKKVIAVMKDELGGKITIKFIRLKGKTYRYLIYDSSEDEKATDARQCIEKIKPKVEHNKHIKLNLKIKLNILKKINLACKKEGIKCNNIIKQQRNV